MSTHATNSAHEVGIDPGENRVTPKLDTIPLELQAMIIGTLESQHFRKAMKYRLVCRRLKEAADLALRKRFVTRIHFTTFLDDFDALRDGRNVFIVSPREDPRLAINMYFSSFSEDNAEAIYTYPYRTTLNLGGNDGTLTGEIGVRFGGARFWPLGSMCMLLWRRTMQLYLARVREPEYPRPCLSHSALIFDFPYMDGVKFNDEKLKLTVPWVKLISCLISRETRFAENLKWMASQDLEATRWKTSNPIVEQGLRTALRSDLVRRVRFEGCFKAASYRLMCDWPDESNWQMTPSYKYSPGHLAWFFEWAEYVGIKLTAS
ncbi:uncharacterized protein F4812DRAFT_306153 [Daldinia caldariorum]|uniref:uncharacterized protein n=1 Tax=Daldinia caldariorum TaxID=326644 RepID=UPI002007A42B|nr:uncharacterized protein F4812DRAFT_306153 [Daldinia caldariorum]KAI1469894.1 hypothetical protein F4812DRAFT_306153 [Daldinia caldariorum]